jgi:hypothetical protein
MRGRRFAVPFRGEWEQAAPDPDWQRQQVRRMRPADRSAKEPDE